MVKIPELHIPKEVWNKLLETAKNNVSKIRVFTLFQTRYKRYIIKDIKERKIKIDERGNVRYDDKERHKIFYPDKKSDVRNCGSVWILPRDSNLELSLEDAYWMGRDTVEVRIRMKSNDKGEVSYKSYWVDVNRTNGEFFPIEIKINP